MLSHNVEKRYLKKAPKVSIFGAFQVILVMFILSGKRDSNPRPSAWDPPAGGLPT